MPKGFRFFGTNFAGIEFGGTANASSAPQNAGFAFDGLLGTKWLSNGQGGDGTSIFLEMDFLLTQTIQSFFVLNTNISDAQVQYFNGSSWVTANSSVATITQSLDLKNLFVELNSPVNATKIKLTGSHTLPISNEKFVTLFLAFPNIGQFQYFPTYQPNIIPNQNVFQTTDGRGVIIERGEYLQGKIIFTSHINQNDIDLMRTLLDRKEAFFIWANGGREDIFKFTFKPYRFQDLYKVAISGSNDIPVYTNNYYRAGYNTEIDIIEVV